jgi:hypothetical protein
VIAHHDNDRAIEPLPVLERAHQASDLRVGIRNFPDIRIEILRSERFWRIIPSPSCRPVANPLPDEERMSGMWLDQVVSAVTSWLDPSRMYSIAENRADSPGATDRGPMISILEGIWSAQALGRWRGSGEDGILPARDTVG